MGDNSLYHVLALISKNHKYNKMKSSFIYLLFLYIIFILWGCGEKEKTGNLGETELYFDERLSSISADGDSAFWIGSEAGDIWYMKQRRLQPYNIGADRIYKVVTDSVLSDVRICWIGIRNSGLQKWALGEENVRLVEKYPICNKGCNYSVYDILLTDKKVYVATSQGLYAMSHSEKDSLKLIYPSDNSETARSGKPFIVNNIRKYESDYLLCATQNGLIRINLANGKMEVTHQDEHIYSVSVYDNKVYLLADKKLYVENISGNLLNNITLKFSPRIYYKLGNIHYFLDDNHLLLSDDLESFLSVPLRRKVPQFCTNVVATDKVNGYTVLITENALWNIPLHLGIFNAKGEIVASCSDGDDIYYVNADNELYHQHTGSPEAFKIAEIPDDEVVSGMMADDKFLYYISNKQVLKRIKVRQRYIGNVLFASSQVLYQSPTKITASYLKKEAEGTCIYLGIQDDLVRIDADGKASLVDDLHNKYITSFYLSPNSDNLYLSTLNHGVYYGNKDSFQSIKGTENKTFIRDISVTGGHEPLLMMLTNHHLICREYNDSVSLKGYNKLLKVNDTLFYALPEFGLVKYVVNKDGIRERGRFFHDIRFNPKASFVKGDTLYLGSNIGVMKMSVFSKTSAKWIDMESTVPSLKIISVVIAFAILIFFIIIIEYIKRKRSKKKAVKMHLDDIHHRLKSLSSMACFTNDNDSKEVEKLKNMFAEIDINASDTPGRIKSLSELIMKKNRDIALGLSKTLEKQMLLIGEYDVFDKPLLIEQSSIALATDNLENIVVQVEKNEKWIKTITALKERLALYRHNMDGTVCIDDVNGIFFRKMLMLTDNIKMKELSSLKEEIEHLDKSYNYIFTDEALKKIGEYILHRKEKLCGLEADNVTTALVTELEHVRKEMGNLDRIKLLKVLYPIDCHIEQVLTKEKMAELMCEYTSVRSKIERENEERITKKFDASLSMEIAESTKQITEKIERLIAVFYENMARTDKDILDNVLEFSNCNNQAAKVLALLIANPKVKRLHIPGMLCIYGNLNPVISRLANNKLKTNHSFLANYVKANPTSIVFYILRLID